MSPNENSRRAEAFRKMLGVAPQAGTNTILITHKPNIVDALGKDWFEVKEGEASVFHPENGSYKLVARVQMDEWSRIAAPNKSSKTLRVKADLTACLRDVRSYPESEH